MPQVSQHWEIHADHFNEGYETLLGMSTRAAPDADGLQMDAGRAAAVRPPDPL